MNATRTETLLMGALLGTGMVQPVESSSKGGTVSFLCRQVPGQEKSWIAVVDQLLMAMEPFEQNLPGSSVHLCRKYLRKEGQMVYGWFFSISVPKAKDLNLVLPSVLQVLQTAKPTLSLVLPVQEAPAPQPTFHAQPVMHQASEPERPPLIRVLSTGVSKKGWPTSEVEIPLVYARNDRNIFQGAGKGTVDTIDINDDRRR